MSLTIWKSLSERAERMSAEALIDVSTLPDWERIRKGRRREFWRCLGLDPRPEACDPAVKEYSTFSGKGFRARNVGFQILPDCWGSAAVYYPDPPREGPAPGVLYVCGHTKTGVWHYQYCPIMWARRGYVCLIVDTIEQHDNPGEHHGQITGRQDDWLAMGYTPAGAEAWNSLRALEVLRSDPAVDGGRIGVTGISGGGAVSFYVAVLDEGIQALSSLCGMSTPRDAIVNRRLFGHCDCMYPHNVFGRDLSEYAALLAPRPALFCFGDHDGLFYPDETAALVRRVSKIYDLYGAGDRCKRVALPCRHEDHPEFTRETQKWFDRHVAGEERPQIPLGEREVSETTASVFQGVGPRPNRLDLLPELLSPRGGVRLPSEAGEWPQIRREALNSLPSLFFEEEFCFSYDRVWDYGEMVWSRHCGRIAGVDVELDVFRRTASRKLLLGVAGGGEWSQHVLDRLASAGNRVSLAGFQPRLSGDHFPGVGPPDFPAGAREPGVRVRLMQAMALTGQTPVMMTVRDIRVLFEYLIAQEEFRDFEIYLYGRAEAGVAALYYTLLDERVAGVIVEDLPVSHAERAPILGSLRAFDIPQAVGLVAPRKMAAVAAGHNNWNWPVSVYGRLGCPERLVMTADLREAFQRVLED